MTKSTLTVAICAILLCAGTAQATSTAQQKCDYARITAWKKYLSCVDSAVAKDAKGVIFDEFAAFAKCRHTYFSKWTAFQGKASLAGSTCIGTRFTDNGDQTVTDNLSGLVWEKKDLLGGIHDVNDYHHTWSTGAPYAENGTAFSSFLGTLNSGGGFGGANGWRLPTLPELQTIVLDFACRGVGLGPTCFCPSDPCIDPALGYTVSACYWSATSSVPNPAYAWDVSFYNGYLYIDSKVGERLVRAVRGGL